MRIIVSLSESDRYVVAILSPAEQEKLYNRLKLRNIGELLEFDDEIEYAYPYYITLRKNGEEYIASFEKEAGNTMVKHLIIKFRKLTDLLSIVEMLERYCNNRISVKEKEILNKHCILTYASCSVVINLDVYNVIKRLWIIARKLNLF